MIQQHGGNILRYRDILDFSANINPLGTPESVKRALEAGIAGIEKYPDPYCTELRERLAEHEKTGAENIVCGNGADDLIFRIVHVLKPRRAIACAPAFTEYSRALAEVGCQITEHRLAEENDFDLTADLADRLGSGFDMCILCTPNNPSGRLISPGILGIIARRCKESGITLVCDESFLGFVPDGEKYSLRSFMNGSSIILKAFTKLYAMPGIRLGCAVCGSPELAGRVQCSGQFWSVSSLAQAAGIAALEETDYVRRTLELIGTERSILASELEALGLRIFSSAANFILFKGAAGLGEKMLGEGILIRDCSNFSGLSPGFYRIAVRTHAENMRLISKLRRCING